MLGELVLNYLENNVPDDGRWYLNFSKLWYMTTEQAKAYLNLSNDKYYSSGIHENEFNLLKQHAGEIVNDWNEDIAVVDLGCRTAEKTLVKIKEAFNQGKEPYFHLVDINPYFLSLAIKNSKKTGLIPQAHLDLIENFPNLLKELRKKHDSIYLNFGINHANFKKEFLNEFYKNMKKKRFSLHQYSDKNKRK